MDDWIITLSKHKVYDWSKSWELSTNFSIGVWVNQTDPNSVIIVLCALPNSIHALIKSCCEIMLPN